MERNQEYDRLTRKVMEARLKLNEIKRADGYEFELDLASKNGEPYDEARELTSDEARKAYEKLHLARDEFKAKVWRFQRDTSPFIREGGETAS